MSLLLAIQSRRRMIRRKPIVPLTSHELRRVAEVATYRQETHERPGVRSIKIAKGRTDYETHYLGTLGESGVAKYLGQPMPTEQFYRYGDDGRDIPLPNGKAMR